MIRKKKKFVRPIQIFHRERIDEENTLVKKYGLKNKTEIWKTQAKINYYRRRAKELARKPHEEQEIFFNKLKALGLNVETISDVLDLKVENLLDRRLSTVVVKKKLATTAKQARQLIVHKKILINGKALSSPSYLVKVAEENTISLKKKVKKPKVEGKTVEESPKEVKENEKVEENLKEEDSEEGKSKGLVEEKSQEEKEGKE
jgi:small subunit ribosomal protein S4